MEKYDLSTITRDQLHFLLSVAKDKMVKYTRCHEEVKRVEHYIGEEKKRRDNIIGCTGLLGLVVPGGIIPYLFFSLLCILFDLSVGGFTKMADVGSSMTNGKIAIAYLLGFVSIALYILAIRWIVKLQKKKPQRKINNYKNQLPELEKNEESAFDKFYEVIEPYKFPRDYWYEYAISQMLKYVENKRADNWKEVTALYEDHLHRLTVEENTRINAEQSKLQAEYAREGRNAARWAAAGAWTAALRR